MTRQKKPALVVTFDTTSQAMAAEALFQAVGLLGRMIPIPSQITAGCGLAWKALPEERDAVAAKLARACRPEHEDALRRYRAGLRHL